MAAVFVAGVVGVVRWLRPTGQTLTLTRPTGGTIIGAGLQCGTRGSDCSATLAEGRVVELRAEADAGYVWSGFSGDCAPAGRMIMSQARSCGATFDRVTEVKGVEWPLTITKPTGGTILAAGGIACGTLDSKCAANLPDGVPVTLHVTTDAGHQFLGYTGDCDARSGETTMTAARTCGATFAPTQKPLANRIETSTGANAPSPTPRSPGERGPRARKPPQGESSTPEDAGSPGIAGTPDSPDAQVESAPSTLQLPTAPDQKPAAPPVTAEEHARKEIEQLVRQYCAEYETLQPERIQKLFPQVDVRALRNQFREYKALKCSVGDLTFDRLDASPAGGAQVKTEMKRVIEMRSGGAPEAYETIVTIVISRMDLRRPWLIDRVLFEAKPKP